jgi:hypothetical protein
MAGMDERKSDERRAVDSVVRWLRIRERSGHPAPTSYAELVDAIGHSALLRRLLAGKTPLRVPPPRSFGQPWYIVEETAEDRMLIRYHREAPVYVAEREDGDPVRWRLTRRDLWPRPALQ